MRRLMLSGLAHTSSAHPGCSLPEGGGGGKVLLTGSADRACKRYQFDISNQQIWMSHLSKQGGRGAVHIGCGCSDNVAAGTDAN